MAINGLFKRYRATSKRRSIEFSLTKETFSRLIAQDCHYCGAKPSNLFKTLSGPVQYNGLDRADNSRGYVDSNVVTACYQCNIAKSDYSMDEFLAWVSRVYARVVKSRPPENAT